MLEDHAIPPEILALMQKPPLLKGESVQQYNDLLGILVSQVAPADLGAAQRVGLGNGLRAGTVRDDLSIRASQL